MGSTKLFLFQIFFMVSLIHLSSAARRLADQVQEQAQLLQYHNGPLLYGKISVNLIWYGNFKPSQRAIISDFISSITTPSASKSTQTQQAQPSVATWWKTTEKYYHLGAKKHPSLTLQMGKQILDKYSVGKSLTSKQLVQLAAKGDQKNATALKTTQTQPSVATWWKTIDKYYHLSSSSSSSSKKHPSLVLEMGKQILDDKYSLGKSLTNKQILELAARGDQKNAINVVLTASDVAVQGFCSSRCGTHGSSTAYKSSGSGVKVNNKFAYIWVGNSETQCPGRCAWPFHQPIYGPQSPPLVAPNNDVGVDGMVINLAGLLAGTVTNPFGNGYFQGPGGAPLEAASACPGVYGKGAYPGYAGELLVDPTTGASYNAHGANGRKYLLPALFDPSTSSCSTPV
uniref:Protein EXORDIUM-like n=1 Tax=Nelumbo nucifera TaxID=4432 RepID=A0A822Z3Z0_NELNU|nr:TPA_asm: hypothetical protein HUJ06_015397 [Nelumbo nucifera]